MARLQLTKEQRTGLPLGTGTAPVVYPNEEKKGALWPLPCAPLFQLTVALSLQALTLCYLKTGPWAQAAPECYHCLSHKNHLQLMFALKFANTAHTLPGAHTSPACSGPDQANPPFSSCPSVVGTTSGSVRVWSTIRRTEWLFWNSMREVGHGRTPSQLRSTPLGVVKRVF